MSKLRVRQVIIVEGRYDATALASLVDGLILTTEGFSIFSDEEQKQLIRRLGRERGLIVLTDSDAAGFQIRNYIEKIASGCDILHAYIPAIPGKEARKSAPSKEGTLGVEGVPAQLLHEALLRAGAIEVPARGGPEISYTDLYELGISGGPGSAERRRALLARLGLPQRLSKKALREVLSSLYSLEELAALAEDGSRAVPVRSKEKPALFWDFHGTLTLPDITWFEVAMEAAAEQVPERPLSRALLERHFSRTCLPWWTVPGGDTRHLVGSEAWWGHCEREFAQMFEQCGFTPDEAQAIAPLLRGKSLQAWRYVLYPDALETLACLRACGYDSYLLSNNFPELPQLAAQLGLGPYLRGYVVSGLIGYDKPHPGIFEEARKIANKSSQHWMVGDNPRDDIEGAKQNGFTTVAVHGLQTPAADHVIDNLRDIIELLP